MEIAKNKKAYFDYEVLEEYDAGIVLTGDEIKSIRAKKAQLLGSYVKILFTNNKPEAFAININISDSQDPTRTRKLLLHKSEINTLIGKVEQKNLTLVPLRLYLRNNKLAKLVVGLVRGKKMHDKRLSIKEREDKRKAQRAIKEY